MICCGIGVARDCAARALVAGASETDAKPPDKEPTRSVVLDPAFRVHQMQVLDS